MIEISSAVASLSWLFIALYVVAIVLVFMYQVGFDFLKEEQKLAVYEAITKEQGKMQKVVGFFSKVLVLSLLAYNCVYGNVLTFVSMAVLWLMLKLMHNSLKQDVIKYWED